MKWILFSLLVCFSVSLPARNVTIVNPLNKPVPIKVAGAGVALPTPTASPVASPTATATATNTPTPTPSAFDPTTIAGLKLWLKADALALSDGAAVASWPDSSGNGNDAAQSVAGERPLFKTNIINGKPVLRFDGVDDFLNANMLGAVTTTASIFIVQLKRNIASSAVTLQSWPAGSANVFDLYLPFSDGNFYFDLGDSTATGRISGAWGGDLTHFFVWSFVAGGGNMAAYRNGTTVLSSGGHTNSFTPAGLTFNINGSGPGSSQDADIAEILIYNTALSDTDRQNVESFLRTKYGLP